MLASLPQDLKEQQPSKTVEILSLYLDTIISEYTAFNHSYYIYPHLKNLRKIILELSEADNYEVLLANIQKGNLDLQQLKVRSSNDPIIQEIEWEHREFSHPASVQLLKMSSVDSRIQQRRSRQSYSCVFEPSQIVIPPQKIPQNLSPNDFQAQEEQYIPIGPIKEFDEQSYISQINFERNPSLNIKEVIGQRIQQSLEHYEDALLDDAYFVIQQAKQEAGENNLSEWLNETHGPFINQIENKMSLLQRNLKELSSDGWIVEKENKQLIVRYKLCQKTSTVTIYMDSIFEANVTRLMAIINEIELYASYAPFVTRSRMAKQLSRSSKVCDIQVYFPFISDRKAYFVGEGFDRLKIDGTIVFMCQSIDEDEDFLKMHNIDISADQKKFVSLTLNYYIFELTPLTPKRCRVRAITNSDPKVRFLPSSLVALVARKMANTLFERMQRISQNFEKTQWYPKYLANTEFYTWIETKVNSYFQSL